MRVCEGEWDAGTLREVELEIERVFTVMHPFWALLCPRVSQFTLASFESHPSGLSTQDVILLATKMILANTVCLSAVRPINKEVQLYFSFILSTYLQVHMSLRFITTSTILTASASSTCLSLQTFLGSKGASLAASVKKGMRVSVLSLRESTLNQWGAESVNKCPSVPCITRFLRDSPGDWAPVMTAVTHLSMYLSLLYLLSHHLHSLGLCRIISQINYLQPSPEFEELLGGKSKLWQEPFSVVKWLHKGIVLLYG